MGLVTGRRPRSNSIGHTAKQAKTALGVAELNVIADRGYFSSDEIRKCQEADVTAYVPKYVTSGAKADGRFGKADFIYDAETNEYRCPARQRLNWRFARVEHGLKLNRYWSSYCPQCVIKAQCTSSDYRPKPLGA